MISFADNKEEEKIVDYSFRQHNFVEKKVEEKKKEVSIIPLVNIFSKKDTSKFDIYN